MTSRPSPQARDRQLDEVRDRVIADWKKKATADKVLAKANEVRDRLAKGEDIAKIATELGLEVKTAEKVMRTTPASNDLPTAAVAAAFSGPKGTAVVSPGTDEGSQVVIVVTGNEVPAYAAGDGHRTARQAGRPDDLKRSHEPIYCRDQHQSRRCDQPGRCCSSFFRSSPKAEAATAVRMLVEPALAEFARNYDAGQAQVVWTRLVADLETPVSAMLKLSAGRANCFLLESVEGGAVRGRYSIIGFEPDLVFRAFGEKAEINADPKNGQDRYEPVAEPSLQALRRLIARVAHPPAGRPAADVGGRLRLSRLRHGPRRWKSWARRSPTRSAFPTRS